MRTCLFRPPGGRLLAGDRQMAAEARITGKDKVPYSFQCAKESLVDERHPIVRQLPASPKIDTSVSHSARIWNYWLGGKDNYPVDREVGDQILSFVAELVRSARADRYFLARAVRFLAAEAGIGQFLDIGTALPTVDNTHEVAQRVNPEAKIVYTDNDPLVLAHARAALAGNAIRPGQRPGVSLLDLWTWWLWSIMSEWSREKRLRWDDDRLCYYDLPTWP
jgi:hypothetical protein